ncbi:hypothetical protein IT575_00070 [bacterium]|nr:hypothetical protein [bacterium]
MNAEYNSALHTGRSPALHSSRLLSSALLLLLCVVLLGVFAGQAQAQDDNTKPPGWVRPDEDEHYDEPPAEMGGEPRTDVSPHDFPLAPPGMGGSPGAVPVATLRQPDFKSESAFEFGIYDKDGKRTATAYYRIVRQELGGEDVWCFKYTGKNETLSENTDCWVGLNNMTPIRSTRKLVQGNQVFYKDLAYSEQGVKVRKKYEGQEVTELNIPLAPGFYDYESLIWLIPLIEFGEERQVRFEIFDTLMEVPTTVIIKDTGTMRINIRGKNYDTHMYSFNVGAVPYRYYALEVGGRVIPARVDMGDTSFVNLQFGSGESKPKKKKRRGRR